MAGFREHIGFSSFLGILVGAAMLFVPGITPIQAILAALLTAFGGMLPDLDAEYGRPSKEIFSLLGAILPVLFTGKIMKLAQLPPLAENILLIYITGYYTVRYGGAWLLGMVAVHRGMFHSVPAMIIASLITFMAFPGSDTKVRGFMGVAVAIGFLSHLVLDEIYSVQWNGLTVRLKKSSGSALKFTGDHIGSNIVTYGLMFSLCYAVYGELSSNIAEVAPPTEHQIYMIGEGPAPTSTN